ncbi:hypothetical protein [Mycetohabitans sp. B46]
MPALSPMPEHKIEFTGVKKAYTNKAIVNALSFIAKKGGATGY